ncbi:MAG TPA: integrase, partial [Maribacter sp.]|nr:integrase [Maribacter sp.]
YKFSISFLDWMINKKGYAESYSRKKIDDLKTVCKDASYDGVEVSLQLGKIKGGKPTNDYVIF